MHMVKMPKSGFRAVPSRTARFLYCICSISSGIFSVFPVTVPPFPPQIPLLQKLQENVATAALCAVFAVFHKEKISFP
jgi:hypothetical protein